VILAGGTSLLPGIQQYLTDKLGQEVVLGNPMQEVKPHKSMSHKGKDILFSNVIGLAWRSVSNPFYAHEINLLPEDYQKTEKKIYNKEKLSVKVFAWTLFLGGIVLLLTVTAVILFM